MPAAFRAAVRSMGGAGALSRSATTEDSSASNGSTSAVLSRSGSSDVQGVSAGSSLADSVFGKPKTYSRRRRVPGPGGTSATSTGASMQNNAVSVDDALDDDDCLDDLLF
jgi:S-formylglutathione hydrolase FrmB